MATSDEKGAIVVDHHDTEERLMLHAVADAANVSAAAWVRNRVRETFGAMSRENQRLYRVRAAERAKGRK